jgi:hydroxypyruvate isomerase
MAKVAEKHKVTLCIEHLNSRDDSNPMKGHPEYMGDNLDEVVNLIKEVGSPRIKILFDIYHVQIMHGDLIRRIKQLGDLIGHVHTAGNPGRCELDPNQEIQYKPVIQALWNSGYRGFIGHEFLPTKDALGGLIQAVTTCAISG